MPLSVEDKLHSSQKRNTRKTIRELDFMLKCFALNRNIEEKHHCRLTFLLIKYLLPASIFGSMTLYSLYYKINYLYNSLNLSIRITDFVQMVYDFCQYLVDLYIAYKYGREMSRQYLEQFVVIDGELGMRRYGALRRRVRRALCACVAVWAGSSACDFAAWVAGYGWTTPLYFAIAYLYLLIKMLTTMDLSAQVIHVEWRLRAIADLLLNYHSKTKLLPGSMPDCVLHEHWLHDPVVTENQNYVEVSKALPRGERHEVKHLTQCYLLLTEQCEFINKMYGIRILLNTLSLLIDMVRFTNIAVRIIIGPQDKDHVVGNLPAVSSILRMLTCACVLISLVEHCERAYRQTDRILRIADHLLINRDPDEGLRSAVTELRGLVQARPVRFNMAHFFTLNYPLLMSITSVVVTYSIILLQSNN